MWGVEGGVGSCVEGEVECVYKCVCFGDEGEGLVVFGVGEGVCVEGFGEFVGDVGGGWGVVGGGFLFLWMGVEVEDW